MTEAVETAETTVEPVYLNRAELASAFKTTPPTVDRWVGQGCPVNQRGGNGREYRFVLGDVAAWRGEVAEVERVTEAAKLAAIEAQQKQLDLAHGSFDDPGMSLPPRMRAEYYRGEQMRIDLALRRGELVEGRDVEVVFERVFTMLADRLQSLPDALERQCNLSPEVVTEIVQAVDDWQAELARDLTDSDILRDTTAAAA